MNELTKSSRPSKTGVSSIMEMQASMDRLADIARDPTVSADKVIALGEFQVKMYNLAREEEFNKDLNKAIDEIPIIKKDRTIKNRGSYSTFERLMTVVRPILKANKLRLRFDPKTEDGVPTVATILTHDNGLEKISGYLGVPASKPNTSVTEAEASVMSVTRAKRHVLKATLSIIEEDDDGTGHLYAVIAKEDWQEELEAEAMKAALNGLEALTKWYKSKPAMERGYLYDTGFYEKLKEQSKQIPN